MFSIILAFSTFHHDSLHMFHCTCSIPLFSQMPENPSSSPTEPPEQSAAFEKWRSGLAQFTGLGLSESEKAERERLKAQGKLAKDWDKCEGWKRDLMNYSELLFLFFYFFMPPLTRCKRPHDHFSSKPPQTRRLPLPFLRHAMPPMPRKPCGRILTRPRYLTMPRQVLQ